MILKYAFYVAFDSNCECTITASQRGTFGPLEDGETALAGVDSVSVQEKSFMRR